MILNNSLDKAAFLGFITGGHPHPDETVDIMLALERGGVDIIELGVPFTDPVADGPVIQESSFVNKYLFLFHIY